MLNIKGPVVQYAPVGGKEGPNGFAEWHLAYGWPEFRRRLLDPVQDYTRQAFLWMACGSVKNPPGNGIFIFNQFRAAMNAADRRVTYLVQGLPDFISELNDNGWTVITYSGSMLDGVFDPEDRAEAYLNTLPYRNSHLIIDAMADAPQPEWEDRFRDIAKVTRRTIGVEGRLRIANSWLNNPRIRKVWMGRFNPSDPERYIPIGQLAGWCGELLNVGPEGRDLHQWQSERDAALPMNIFRILDIRGQIGAPK